MTTRKNCPRCPGRLLFFAVAFAPWAQAAVSVTLTPSIPSPAPLGTLVTFTAAASDTDPGALWIRFRERRVGGDFHIVRDFSTQTKLDWTSADYEGDHEIEVTARNVSSGGTAAASALYTMTSRVSGGTPAISPTAHPLVFLYSAPPCDAGKTMAVQFQTAGVVQQTPIVPCRADASMNFYLAGLKPSTEYSVRNVVIDGALFTWGPALTLTTPRIAQKFAAYTVMHPAQTAGVLLQSALFEPTLATDLKGNPIWYYTGTLSFLTRPMPGGRFFGIVQDPSGDLSLQVVREFDLAGTTLRETNAARINEQLAALGKRQIGAFHHEALGLHDGKILTLASTEQLLTGVQGPGTVDVLGDMILVLDQDLQVVWTWDAFDHLDPHRTATLNEICTAATGGCPPLHLATHANDWLHGNALEPAPDGNILYSARHQDWLIKIDYRMGSGTGAVLWRLGNGGDFRFASAHDWFSHQHDANLHPGSIVTLFDNNNVANAADNTRHSRGQVWRLDERNRVITPLLDMDLGGFSVALGTAQVLPNGHYHFDIGWLAGNRSESVEVGLDGAILYDLRIAAPMYRTFRMPDLYTAEAPAMTRILQPAPNLPGLPDLPTHPGVSAP
jgi:arylsulfate sulfotransferase